MTMHTDEPRDALLDSHFDALRGALAQRHTPPGVEKELMAAFARQYPKRRWYQSLSRAQWGVAGGLGSAAAVVALLMLSLHAPLPVGSGAEPLAGFAYGGAFIALESIERIKQEPAPRIVETEVARTALAPLGVPVTPENAGDWVRAEMLLSANGQPLALRLSTLQ